VASTERISFFEAVGGEETFRRLTERFYRAVAADPLLRALYPDEDLAGAEERLRLFLIQYWGGPNTYSQRRGHPALRMRHARFAIGQAERDAWLRHMTEAIESLGLEPPLDQMLLEYVTMASGSLINRRG
jgi:hemoglobin